MPPFKKGQVGGPGRPKTPDDIAEIRKLNRFEIERCMNDCLLLTREQMVVKSKDPETTMLQLLVMSIINSGVKQGDHQKLSFILDRLIGKNVEKLDIRAEANLSLTPQNAQKLKNIFKEIEDEV